MLNDYFQNDAIDEKTNFWIETMLNQFNTQEGSDYRCFMGEKSEWEINTGFLAGLSGVGLTLLSLSDPELSDWKKVLLL
jgi:Lanthionine synthetase C-like protein